MSPRTETFYYKGFTKEQEKQHVSPLVYSSTAEDARSLYADKELTKKIGILKTKRTILGNTKQVPILDLEKTITTNEGVIKYKHVRDSYKKVTLDTEQTSGLFTKGTITRTYLEEDNIKQIRKLVYKSAE